MTLELGDSFEGVFIKYGITEKDVITTYSKPDKIEYLINKITLFIKSLHHEEKTKDVLLVATQEQNGVNLLAFTYWVPKDIQFLKNSCLDVLEIFAHRFGLKIKIGQDQGYLIKYSNRMIFEKIEDPNSLIEILAPQQIPCENFIFTSEQILGTINTVHIYYAFAINTSKYIFWLDSIPFIQFEIKACWYDFVKDIVDYVEPSGRTGIKTVKQKFTSKLEDDISSARTKIEVPKMYENQFRHIIESINSLKNKEKILFKISFSSPRCLFCNSAQISKEHIFPKWLRPYLPETIMEGTQFMNLGNESLREAMDSSLTSGKKESSRGYTTNLVCTNCNNTWMSKLENQTKEILLDKGALKNSIQNEITQAESYILSQWLILKSLLLSNKVASNIHEITSQIFSELKKGKINNGFIVEYSKAENYKLDFCIIKGIQDDKLLTLRKMTLPRAKELSKNLFICCIHMGYLMFRVSYLDNKIPLKRIATLYKTLTLFPFEMQINHQVFNGNTDFMKTLVNSNLEMYLFPYGLLLSD